MWRVLKRCDGSEFIWVSGNVAVSDVMVPDMVGPDVMVPDVMVPDVILGIDLLSRGVQVGTLASASSTPPLSPTAPECHDGRGLDA
jgi:hypothetical protein